MGTVETFFVGTVETIYLFNFLIFLRVECTRKKDQNPGNTAEVDIVPLRNSGTSDDETSESRELNRKTLLKIRKILIHHPDVTAALLSKLRLNPLKVVN